MLQEERRLSLERVAEQKKEEARRMMALTPFTKLDLVDDGYIVLQRNEFLDVFVGPLSPRWRKAQDKPTER